MVKLAKIRLHILREDNLFKLIKMARQEISFNFFLYRSSSVFTRASNSNCASWLYLLFDYRFPKTIHLTHLWPLVSPHRDPSVCRLQSAHPGQVHPEGAGQTLALQVPQVRRLSDSAGG